METDHPREQMQTFSETEEAYPQPNLQLDEGFPLKFPRSTLPERWKAWFDCIDR